MRTPLSKPGGGAEARLVLAEASGAFSSWLNIQTAAERVARAAVPDFCDWCVVDLVADDDTLHQATSGHPDPRAERLLMAVRERYRRLRPGVDAPGARRVIHTGRTELFEDAQNIVPAGLSAEESRRFRALGVRSYLLVPLATDGDPFGAITFLSTGRVYNHDDLPRVEGFARAAADTLERHWAPERAERRAAVLDTVYRTAPVGFAFVDTDGVYQRVNETLAAINGLSVSEHVGRPVEQVLGRPFGTRLAAVYRHVLETGEPAIGIELDGDDHPAPGERKHWLASYSPVRIGGEVVGVAAVIQDITERKRHEAERARLLRRARFLAAATATLDASLDYETTLRRLAELVVPDAADWCAVHVLDSGGALRLAACHDPSGQPWRTATSAALAERAVAARETAVAQDPATIPAELTTDGDDRERLGRLDLHAAASAPLLVRGHALGALTLGFGAQRSAPSEEQSTLTAELAARAALSIDNARLYGEQRRIAETLQSALLPHVVPQPPGAEIAVRYRAVGELNRVGGDFYDVFERPGGDWLVLVGDVTGKGARAAAATALVRYTLRTAARQPIPPSQLARILGEEMRAQSPEGPFCTVCLASVRPRAGGLDVTIVLAGHPPALVLRASGAVEPLGALGSLLGAFSDPRLTDARGRLERGDTLLLYTDGAYDAAGPHSSWNESALGTRLAQLSGRGPAELVRHIEEDAVRAAGGEPEDDIALVALRATGA